MRNLIFLLVLTAPALPLSAQTEIKISPIPLLFTTVAVSVEQGLSDSWGLDGDLIFGEDIFAVNLSGKFYFDPRYGLDRFHVGVFTGFLDDNVGLGFLAGTKILSKNRILFEVGLGIGRAFDDEAIIYGKLHLGYRFQKRKKTETVPGN